MTVIQFAVKKAPSWISVFDDAYWQSYNSANWNATFSRWEAASPFVDMELEPKTSTTWYQGFYPTKMRITGVKNGMGMSGYDIILDSTAPESAPYIGSGLADDLPVIIDLDFATLSFPDLAILVLHGYDNVTNIEFLNGTLG